MSAAGLDLGRIWRGHVQPVLSIFPERTAFVDATTERGARLKIAAAIAGLEGVRPEDVDVRIYNVKSARKCIDEGQSQDHELRLFEIGWGADGIVFVEDPLFLMQKPGPLAHADARGSPKGALSYFRDALTRSIDFDFIVTTINMRITCNSAKRAKTLQERGLDFRRAREVFDRAHVTVVDDRRDYGELRFITAGWLDERLVVFVWTPCGRAYGVISMRKANEREIKRLTPQLA